MSLPWSKMMTLNKLKKTWCKTFGHTPPEFLCYIVGMVRYDCKFCKEEVVEYRCLDVVLDPSLMPRVKHGNKIGR